MIAGHWQGRHPRRMALGWLAAGHLGMAWWVAGSGPGSPEDAILFESWPLELRVGLWAVVGVFLAVGAACGRVEPLAWAAAVVMPAERAVGYGWSWIHSLIPGEPPGNFHAVGTLLFWTSVSALTIYAAQLRAVPPEGATGG